LGLFRILCDVPSSFCPLVLCLPCSDVTCDKKLPRRCCNSCCRLPAEILGPWLSSWQQGPKNDECANVAGLLPHPRSWPWPLLHSAELPWLLCCSRWKSFAAATKFQSILGLLDNIWCNMSRIRDYIWFGGANSSCNSASPSRQKFVQV